MELTRDPEGTGSATCSLEQASEAPRVWHEGDRVEQCEGIEPIEISERLGVEPSARHCPSLREFRAEHADAFLEPMSRTTRIERFDDPERTSKLVNPDRVTSMEAYHHNCADCSRSFERTWRGYREEAAGRAYQIAPNEGSRFNLVAEGEQSCLTEEWCGEKLTSVEGMDQVREVVQSGGHGTSAIVHTQFEGENGEPGGHAYNIVNFHGRVEVVDAQAGEVLVWKPCVGHPWMKRVWGSETICWGPDGRRLL
jgi:hypothetical protein